MLIQRARERPVLIALDDLQQADLDSIALLRFVTPALSRARLWILGSLRTGAAGAEAQLKELAALEAETATQTLELRGLHAQELVALLEHRLKEPIGPDLAELLARRTEGNPLYALEIAHSLQTEGKSLLRDQKGATDVAIARGLGPLVARRLSALSPDAQQLLRAASAFGTEFDIAVLRAAQDCTAAALARAVEEGTNAGFLAESAPGRGRFTHPLFAESVYEALQRVGPDAVAAQHLRIGEALRRLRPDDSFALARHFTLAGKLAEPRTVLGYARAAAVEALRRYAFANAEHWFREAIRLADGGEATPGELCDLLVGSGQSLLANSGQEKALLAFARAARLAAQIGDARRLAIGALSYAHRPFLLGTIPMAEELLAAARTTPCGDAALEARVASRLGYGGSSAPTRPRPKRAR